MLFMHGAPVPYAPSNLFTFCCQPKICTSVYHEWLVGNHALASICPFERSCLVNGGLGN